MRKKTLADHAKAAAKAHTDLNVFYGVIALMEGGLMSADSQSDVQRLIASCQRASAKCLARYDAALLRLSRENASD
jgi:hypothetical protein